MGSCHQIDDTHLPQDTSNQGPLEVVDSVMEEVDSEVVDSAMEEVDSAMEVVDSAMEEVDSVGVKAKYN